MGIECSGNDQYNLGDHVIASSGTSCQFQCKSENGEKYRPNIDQKRNDKFSCLTPIPIQMYSENCYRNPFKVILSFFFIFSKMFFVTF